MDIASSSVPSHLSLIRKASEKAARGENIVDLQLANSVAVIIGGAKGIGQAIVRGFAQEGAHVAIVDVDTGVQSLADELAAAPSAQTLAAVADATDYESLQTIAARVISEFGRVDHLIYAAGAGSGKYGFPFWNLSPADWQRVLDINLLGAVNAAHAFTPEMTAARQGTVLFLSSIAGQIGSQTDPPYSAAKAAVINFAQCAAKDLAQYDVRVNTICPGMVKTAVNESVWQAWQNAQPESQQLSYDEWATAKIAATTPLNRWQEPADVAALALYLASPLAHNITGQTMNVDGGIVMHS